MKSTPPVVLVKAKPFFGFPPRLASIFNRVKNTQVVHFVVVADVSHPFINVVRKSDACNSALVGGVSFLIERVKKFWNVSKVFPSVVGFIAIDVVNLAVRHLSCHEQKCKAVRSVDGGVDANCNITFGGNASCFSAFVFEVPHSRFDIGGHMSLAGAKHIRGGGFVEKLTRFGVVLNPFGQIGLAGHGVHLLNYFMPKYSDSAANINRRAA